MHKLKSILPLLLLVSTSLHAQTPYDDFAPEVSRPILELGCLSDEPSIPSHDTTSFAMVIDMQHEQVLLIDAQGEVVAYAPMTDDIRKWLSVDPLADKYPEISPYAYCAWNPIKYTDPDGRKVVYNDETSDCESMVNDYCAQSDMFNTVYKQLVESNNTYTFQFGKTTNDVDGQFVPSKNGGVITLNRESAWSSAIPEETFHALQYDNRGKYNESQLNLEFEAKVFVIMSGLPTGSYYGMDEDYHSSLLKMDIKEFTQPQSISEYIKQANIYSGYNKDNTIGNQNYWIPTIISPFDLISIIKRQK